MGESDLKMYSLGYNLLLIKDKDPKKTAVVLTEMCNYLETKDVYFT